MKFEFEIRHGIISDIKVEYLRYETIYGYAVEVRMYCDSGSPIMLLQDEEFAIQKDAS